MTFEPQPREYFSAERAPARLMRLREKIETLLSLGVDSVVCLQFNRQLRNLSAADFVEQVLVRGLAVKHLIVGDDFRFGCDRSGDFAMLNEQGKLHGFEVQDTATVEADGRRVSSTLIREVVEQADFARAAQLLGRPFAISGVVGYGQQLGRELGFPTANVQLNRFSAPLIRCVCGASECCWNPLLRCRQCGFATHSGGFGKADFRSASAGFCR